MLMNTVVVVVSGG